MEFTAFPKMPRLSREMIITEKIDGTNAQICIMELEGYLEPGAVYEKAGLALFAGSRTRWITPENDNYGFAKWCQENGEELLALGPGRHFGEWWGQGIQRGYDLKEKRFSLFNVSRWCGNPNLPQCCHVVPTLYNGNFDTGAVDYMLDLLRFNGSYAAPGFKRPEGVVVFHTAGNFGFKKTLEKDEVPKSLAKQGGQSD
jgi:hypothetical protein